MVDFKKIIPVVGLLASITLLTGCSTIIPEPIETPVATFEPIVITKFKVPPTFLPDDTHAYLESQGWTPHEDELDAGLTIYATDKACSVASNILVYGETVGTSQQASFEYLSEQAIINFVTENQIKKRIVTFPLNVGDLGILNTKVLEYKTTQYEAPIAPEDGELLSPDNTPPLVPLGSRSGFVLSYIFPQPLPPNPVGGESHPSLLVRYECADTDVDPVFWQGFIETLKLDVSGSL